MSNWDQVKNGGKGSGRRSGANDQAYKDNWERIFGKPCPECGLKGDHKMDCQTGFREKNG